VPVKGMGVQVPPRTHKPAHFHRFHYRLNTRPCGLPLRGDFTGLRGQAALQVPGGAGNPPQAHRLTAPPAALPGLSRLALPSSSLGGCRDRAASRSRDSRVDGLISKKDNPASKVEKPRRLPSTRRAIAGTRLAEINRVAATTGDDPELDALILRLHTETACRRGGALALRPQDLDPDQCLVLLREKGETFRWQPVSPTLMAGRARHAGERHAPKDGRLLRYRDGRPVTYRRYDGLWERIGQHLPWVRTQGISTHWIRHTTLTWVERNFGLAVAHAFAGHTDSAGDTGTATMTYVRATFGEVCAALAALTGEPHPLAALEGATA